MNSSDEDERINTGVDEIDEIKEVGYIERLTMVSSGTGTFLRL